MRTKYLLYIGLFSFCFISYGQDKVKTVLEIEKTELVNDQIKTELTDLTPVKKAKAQTINLTISTNKTVVSNTPMSFKKLSNNGSKKATIKKLQLTPVKTFQEVKMTFKKMNEIP